MLNKQEKEELVIKLHKEGKSIRQIAHVAHLSFTDIGSIIRKIDGRDNDDGVESNIDIKNKTRETKALFLFSIGKTSLQVAKVLDLPASEVHDMG